jgi:hypothetical protein
MTPKGRSKRYPIFERASKNFVDLKYPKVTREYRAEFGSRFVKPIGGGIPSNAIPPDAW